MESSKARAHSPAAPSLKEKATEAGVDLDRFLSGIAKNQTDTEIAQELKVPEEVISHLRHHFLRLGLGSVFGKD